MLIAPLLLGSIVGLRAAFGRQSAAHWGLLRTPLEARFSHGVMRIASERERRATEARILFFAFVAVVSAAFVLALLPIVPALLAAGVAAFAYGAGWFASKRQAQVLAAVAMAAGAPLACMALFGDSTQMALLLFAASATIAADQVIYVHLQVAALQSDTRGARWRAGWGFLLFQTLIVVAMALALRSALLVPIAVIGLAPLLARGYWHFARGARRLSFRRLGFTELAYTALAVAGLAAGIRV